MKLPSVIREDRLALQSVLKALSSNITAEDNLAPDGTAGQVLMSNGPNSPPSWQDIPTTASTSSGITGSGAEGTLARWRYPDRLDDSYVTQTPGLITVASDLTVTGNTTVNGNVTVSGNTILGDATSDTITTTARFASAIVPATTDSYNIGDPTQTWLNAYFEGVVYAGGLASLQTSDPLASGSATTPITIRGYGRAVVEHRTDSTAALDGPGMHFVRRSSTGGAAQIYWLIGEFSFSGGYASGSQTLVNAGIYAQARETFTTYGTHGAADLVFATKKAGTGTSRAAEVLRILAEGHTVPHTDNALDLGADSTTGGGTTRRWRSLRLATDLRTDAGTSGSGIVHQYIRMADGTLQWGVGLIHTGGGSNVGADYAIWRYSDGGALLGNWLTVTRASGAWTVTGNGTVTGTFAITGATLAVNGLTYTWPVAQTANRVLRNTGPGTLAWSQVALTTDVTGVLPEANGGTNQSTYTLGDLLYASAANTLSKLAGQITTTKKYLSQTGTGAVSAAPTWAQVDFADISGIIASAQVSGAYPNITGVGTLASGAIPASLVTAGTFGAGAYTFPSTVTTKVGLFVDAGFAGGGVNWQDAGVNRMIMRLDSASVWSMIARDSLGNPIDVVLGVTTTAGGTIAFSASRPITGGTYNGQTIAAAASFTDYLTVLGGGLAGGDVITAGTSTRAINTYIAVNSAAGVVSGFAVKRGGVYRWIFGANSTTESGSDAGTPLIINAYGDTGTGIDTPVTIVRAAGGQITLTRPSALTKTLSVGSTAPVTSQLLRVAGTHTDGSAASPIGILTAFDPVVGVTTAPTQLYVQNRIGANALTSAIGISIPAPTISTGSVTNLYGISVSNQGVAGVGTSYGILVGDQSGSTTTYAMMLGKGLVRMRGQRILLGGSTPTSAGIVQITQSEADPLASTTQRGLFIDFVGNNAATGLIGASYIRAQTAAAAFAATAVYGVQIGSTVLGAGSAITTNYGLYIEDQTVGATNYALYTGLGTVRLGGPLTVVGQITSTLATGTSPFSITSTTVNTNLNADLLDGQHGSYYNDATNLTGVVTEAHGGTNQSSYTLGDMLYASAANTLSKLAGQTTTTKKFLTQTGTGTVSAAPTWATIATSDLGTGSPSATNFLRGDGAWKNTPYTIQFCGETSTTLPDGVILYIGNYHNLSSTNIANYDALIVPRDGTITQARMTLWCSPTIGSNEAWPAQILVNGVGYTFASVSSSSNPRDWVNTGLSISVSAGDRIQIALTNPTWATNPQGTLFSGALLIE